LEINAEPGGGEGEKHKRGKSEEKSAKAMEREKTELNAWEVG